MKLVFSWSKQLLREKRTLTLILLPNGDAEGSQNLPYLTFTLGCFSYIYKSLLCSHVWLFATLWTVARQAPLSMGFSRQEYWSGLSCPPLGDLPKPGIEPRCSTLQADSLLSEPPGYSVATMQSGIFSTILSLFAFIYETLKFCLKNGRK